jgi:hypothetical protein
MLRINDIGTATIDRLTELVYELLDAHHDTARLAGDVAGDVAWTAHLDYLRDLQRVGRGTLAQLAIPGQISSDRRSGHA